MKKRIREEHEKKTLENAAGFFVKIDEISGEKTNNDTQAQTKRLFLSGRNDTILQEIGGKINNITHAAGDSIRTEGMME